MTRGRSDGLQKKHLVASVCGVAIFLGFLYVNQNVSENTNNITRKKKMNLLNWS